MTLVVYSKKQTEAMSFQQVKYLLTLELYVVVVFHFDIILFVIIYIANRNIVQRKLSITKLSPKNPTLVASKQIVVLVCISFSWLVASSFNLYSRARISSSVLLL